MGIDGASYPASFNLNLNLFPNCMKKIFTPLFLACVIAAASGCASIVSKTSYPVVVATNPPGATVTIKNRDGAQVFQGQSPASARLKSGAGFFKGATYTIQITKDGFADRTVQVTSKVNGWYFGNLLFGGFVGMLIIDPATGAMYKLENTVISEILNEKTASVQEPTLNIYSRDSIPASWQAHLVQIN
jgi:hypothetical protein